MAYLPLLIFLIMQKMFWEKITFITLDFRHLHFGVNLFMKKLPQSRRVILPCNIDTRTTSTVGLWCHGIPDKWFPMIDKLSHNYCIELGSDGRVVRVTSMSVLKCASSPRSNPFVIYVKEILLPSTKNTVTELWVIEFVS